MRFSFLARAYGACLFTVSATAAEDLPNAARADDFYHGKTISFIVGYGPGGGVDAMSRIIVKHLPRFIPGHPEMISQTMEGAGGIIAGNHLAKRATPDGLTFGLPGRSWFVEGIVKSPGVTFDPQRFTFIGSTGTNNSLLWLRADLGIKSLDALRAHPGKIAAAGIGAGTPTVTIPNMLAEYGYPLKAVLGYNSTNRALLAIEQGEVGAYFTPEDSFAQRPDLVRSGVVTPVVQSKPKMPGLPLLRDIVPAKDRAVLDLFMAYDDVGLMIVGPPDIPVERANILRKAFADMGKDAEFQADATQIGESAGAPITGEALAATIAELTVKATPEVVADYRRLGAAK